MVGDDGSRNGRCNSSVGWSHDGNRSGRCRYSSSAMIYIPGQDVQVYMKNIGCLIYNMHSCY